ncbi:unnamed protein product, partial [Owenia fusiformis]
IPDPEAIMRRLTDDPLAPPFSSPKSESILTMSDEHAMPDTKGSSPDGGSRSAKDALLEVLEKSGVKTFEKDQLYSTNTDPVMMSDIALDVNYDNGEAKGPPSTFNG